MLNGTSSYSTGFLASPTTSSFSRSPSPPRHRRPPRGVPKTTMGHFTSDGRISWIRAVFRPRIVAGFSFWIILVWVLSRKYPSSRWWDSDDDRPFLDSGFPPPPRRANDDSLDSVDPRWRPYTPLAPPEGSFPRLRPTRFLPERCMEQWFADGEMLCGGHQVGAEEKLDATWLWVNGSDDRWRTSLSTTREAEGIFSPEHHYREQGELVASIRSVVEALPGRLRTLHIITADSPFQEEDVALLPEELKNTSVHELVSNWRIAQTPTWLDFSKCDPSSSTHPYHPDSSVFASVKGGLNKAEKAFPTLRYATHSEIFHLPTLDRRGETADLVDHHRVEDEWRQEALPTFNSMAIESRIGWIPGLADVTLALNDDFFILTKHAVSDFHSPLYGSVIRFDHGFYQQVRAVLDKTRVNDAGEVGGLYHANYILSKRFPRRLRPYFAHAPKVITRGLHHEASLIFKEDLFTSTKRRFREVSHGDGDIQMHWLLTSLRVERWREALLWTYVVANIGQLEGGIWGMAARHELSDMFDLREGDEDVIKIEVHRGERWTLEHNRMERAFEQVGWEAPTQTEFLFSSLDGHMPPILRPGSPESTDKCMFELERCLGPFWGREETVSAQDMFSRLTFQYPECGDCLIMALVTASGPLGLSAFFPEKSSLYTNPATSPPLEYLPPPHLPLTSTWQAADFSLSSVIANTAPPGETVDLRMYTMKLLSRYLYLSGKSRSHFHMILNPKHAREVFSLLDRSPDVSILGLNDDINKDYDETSQIMSAWFTKRWPRKMVWERGWHPHRDRLKDS